MGWVTFLSITAVYWIIGIKRIPTYYKRVDESNRNSYPLLHEEGGMRKEAAWGALGLAVIWPLYETCRFVQNYIIHSMTAEERKQEEYKKAEKIVADYVRDKDRKEREAFDRELKGK